jgi:hypothetical protein
MPVIPASDRDNRFAPAEYIFFAAVILGWAIFVASAGKDPSWDFRNYHWYIPYAFLHGRMGIDVAVAHQATFYNPLLDIPFYLLATHTHAWFALGILGAVQGSNIVPLYAIARSLLTIASRKLVAAILSFTCMTGSLTIYLAGTTYYDNVMSVFVLTGLALVITQRERLRDGSLAQGAALAGLAGVLIGSAVGLKLPEAPFALGFAAALLVLPGDATHRTTRLLAGGAGGLLGIAIFAGFWMVKMEHLTGNPLFPYFNEYFNSPLALHASYRDMRFIPHRLDIQLLFPLLFSIDWRVADDLPFHDIRVAVRFATSVEGACCLRRGGSAHQLCSDFLPGMAQGFCDLPLHSAARNPRSDTDCGLRRTLAAYPACATSGLRGPAAAGCGVHESHHFQPYAGHRSLHPGIHSVHSTSGYDDDPDDGGDADGISDALAAAPNPRCAH